MKRLIAPLFAVVLLLSAAATARGDTQEYVCHPVTFPDGTEGVAVVRVEMSGGAVSPTVMVTVEYYTEGRATFLGRYEDWTSSSDFPTDEYAAEEFALAHYYERW
jgi:hypothetical protein